MNAVMLLSLLLPQGCLAHVGHCLVAHMVCRFMPLTAAGGANAVNSTNGETASAVDSKEQTVKKPKAQDKLKTAAAVAKKRGLKRL